MWSWVQPEVAKTTRVCTYDRAGSGWSDAGPLPRDAARFANELHTLLQNANVPGPYVIVGHSLGGLTARVFAHEYAADVSGVVLIESMSPRQFTYVPLPGQPPAYAQVGPSSFVQPLLARLGLARLLVRPLGLMPALPEALQGPYLSRLARPSNLQATTEETRGLPASGMEASAAKSFGDLPLIVLTARLNTAQPNWQTWQTELLELSSNSQHLFAEKSGHNIEIEEPAAAVAAILQMVRQVRGQ
jgi:pimeloyl-ACP methyl ester carboxylesterase